MCHPPRHETCLQLYFFQIYGKGENPIYRLAQDHGLKTTPNDKNNVSYFDDFGKLKDQQKGESISQEFETIKKKLVDYAGEYLFKFMFKHTRN